MSPLHWEMIWHPTTAAGRQSIKVILRPYRTLKEVYTKPKDAVPLLMKLNVIYKIKVQCSDCSASHIGDTKSCLKTSVEEHKRAIKSENFEASTLPEQCWTADPKINWTDLKTSSQEQDLHQRLSLEAVFIRNQLTSLNRHKGSFSPLYNLKLPSLIPL